MKKETRFMLGILLGVAGVFPALAQTSPVSSYQPAPLTRADVEADLVAWRAAGFKPPINYEHYPANAQQAGRIVAEQRAKPLGQ
ncbi:MAG TPA: DUF4148 domain-containing protein [Paraburkholderia sp.]|uniref:DUF4148 domain-containing protein n=1 Tax=Paraburkholderia sp. TaxID=1926495 RepID=UPI002CE1E64F|nr:DUF4148 domain-containing protein [Paraburkholderia sp.]HTR10505.1 DUF4148 domain-containing protein [Paraburkholderia sp.]